MLERRAVWGYKKVKILRECEEEEKGREPEIDLALLLTQHAIDTTKKSTHSLTLTFKTEHQKRF